MTPATIDGIVKTTFDFGRMMRQKMMSSGKADLHMAQLHVLALAQERTGITMTEVADYLHVSSPTATTIVGRLVTLGYLKRKHDTKNRKLVRVSITSDGSRILLKKMSEKKKCITKVLSVLSPDDRKNLLRILQQLLQQFPRL